MFSGDKLKVEWFQPLTPASEQEVSKCKIIHIGNLSTDVKQDLLVKTFEHYGEVTAVHKIKDYAFIHMDKRDHALKAVEALNGAEMGGLAITCGISKSGAMKRKIKRKTDKRRLRGPMDKKKLPPKPKKITGKGGGRAGGSSGRGKSSGGKGRGGHGGGREGYGGKGRYGDGGRYGGGGRYRGGSNYGYGGYGGYGGGGYGGKRRRDDRYGGGGGGGYGGGGYGGGGYGGKRRRDDGWGRGGGSNKYRKY